MSDWDTQEYVGPVISFDILSAILALVALAVNDATTALESPVLAAEGPRQHLVEGHPGAVLVGTLLHAVEEAHLIAVHL